MTSPLSSALAARSALATRLRHLRLDAGLAGHQLSLVCGWHPAKTSRIENTRAVPSDADIRAWCAACGADGQAEDLIAAARTATSMYVEWKRLNRAGLASLQQEIVPLVERTRAFRVYCSHVVPGLLQTPEYAAAVITAYGTFHGAADDVAAAAAARVKRSKVLHKRGRQFAFLIEESVLHSRIADPETTAAQLEHLAELAGLPQVSLGVVATRARGRCGRWSPSPSTTTPRSVSSCCPHGSPSPRPARSPPTSGPSRTSPQAPSTGPAPMP